MQPRATVIPEKITSEEIKPYKIAFGYAESDSESDIITAKIDQKHTFTRSATHINPKWHQINQTKLVNLGEIYVEKNTDNHKGSNKRRNGILKA